MRTKMLSTIGGLLLAASAGGACAMTSDAAKSIRCSVQGSELLPAEIGGADAICAEIHAAVAHTSPGTEIAVRVMSPHRATAAVTTADGKRLPDVNVAASDAPLGRRSIKMLADGIARQLAERR